jgi:hypothetical protein
MRIIKYLVGGASRGKGEKAQRRRPHALRARISIVRRGKRA